MADVLKAVFLLSYSIALTFLFLQVLIIHSQSYNFLHHQYFRNHMRIINLIDLVPHEDGLFISFVLELGDLIDSLFGFLNIALVVLVFYSVFVDGLWKALFFLIKVLKLIDANISRKCTFNKTVFKLLKKLTLILADSFQHLLPSGGEFHWKNNFNNFFNILSVCINTIKFKQLSLRIDRNQYKSIHINK